MKHAAPSHGSPAEYIARYTPDVPVLFFAPSVLRATAAAFLEGFDGLVTYAVKANDRAEVLANLVACGITAFDVASPAEMEAVRAVCPTAVLHYNNPVRSEAEVAAGIAAGVVSWSVDHMDALDQLAAAPRSNEVAVRFALPVEGAAYNFGDKFGATPDAAAELLRAVAGRGFKPSLCFHPGTQCEDPAAWAAYIVEAARIAAMAQVRIAWLNIGGGFAADRGFGRPDHAAVFDLVSRTVASCFGAQAPALLCEPGRAMVAGSCVLATRIKALRGQDGAAYLNDGIYGGLADMRDMGACGLITVHGSDGALLTGPVQPRQIFGPTCDSLDQLPGPVALPVCARAGDYVLFGGVGAYSIAMSTGFNGYGLDGVQMVNRLSAH